MTTRMLIDATHEEETRVVVVKGNQVEEFDFETANRRALKGNIYLARVTRVEPSLQAAFVDFGGNRHGFLAFSEIHPDYYQIPVADRERLKREEAAAAAADDDDDEDEEEEEHAAAGERHADEEPEADDDAQPDAGTADALELTAPAPADRTGGDDDAAPVSTYGVATPSAALPERSGLRRVARLFGFGAEGSAGREGGETAGGAAPAFMGQEPQSRSEDGATAEEAMSRHATDDTAGDDAGAAASADAAGDTGPAPRERPGDVDDEDRPARDRDDSVEAFGGDAVDEVRRRSSKRRPLTRRYKIQEVIKRRQILLVQVVKEERGNKGAALTTYLSLAGRYCVLMPNSPNGGGISRKIVSALDRKRLKAITSELDVPDGMGMIVRTAGMERNRAEIKRDFEFLLRSWDSIRELTLASMAPCLVYEEANLIKRAIRDLYNKDIDEILVEGENGYRHAKDFMKMLMPSHSKRVQPYKDRIPLFHRYQTEAQLDEMFFPTVQLRSGGYIVINATEALVAIDVNSGRSTKEHNIESTAYKTNMEAAEEVARQLRLRDMAGLIVIDFIDMDESRNARNVERKLKECLKLDRARIQVGRISSFGLLEMSRQRLRPSLVEQSMVTCPHCDGQGHVRSVESATIRAIRAAEDEGIRERSAEVTLIVPTTVAIYLLNSKRDVLEELEGRYGMRVLVKNDDTLGPSEYNLERSKIRSDGEPPVQRIITAESVPYRESDDLYDENNPDEDMADEAEAEAVEDIESVAAPERAAAAEDDEEQKGGRGKRRRRRRPRRGGEETAEGGREAGRSAATENDAADAEEPSGDQAGSRQASDGDDPDADGEGTLSDGASDDESRQEAAAGDEDGDDSARRGRRRGRRGGRRRRRRQDGGEQVDAAAGEGQSQDDGDDRPAAGIAGDDEDGLTPDGRGDQDDIAPLPAADAAAEDSPAAGQAEAMTRADEDRPAAEAGPTAALDEPEPVAEPAAMADASAPPEVSEDPAATLASPRGLPDAGQDDVATDPGQEDQPPAGEIAAPEDVPEDAEEPAAAAAPPVAAPEPVAEPEPIAEPEPVPEPEPETHAPTAASSSDAADSGNPRRGWWRRPARQDGDAAGDSQGQD